MINRQDFWDFVKFIQSRPALKSSFLLGLFFLLLLPGVNFYYNLRLTPGKPVVRPLNLQLPPTSTYPVNLNAIPAPAISARSAMVVDVQSRAILYQLNPDLKLLPASTTKIMTALIALDTYPLSQIITINSVNGEGQQMGLELGERITVENLLYGLLVQSGNDAAIALAQHHPQGEAGFIQDMNQKAQTLNLLDTQFTNPVGFDDFGHYTTVHDLSLLAAEAMKNPVLKKMVSTIGITVSDVDNTIAHELEAINELLGQVPGLAGIKTGWTELAGECLITFTKRGQHQIITTVLGSQDRFSDSQQLIDWAFTHHQWQPVPGATH
jgi:D-alanyl-D-alanine carboxypeptidase